MRKVDIEPINDALYEIDRGRSIEVSDFHRIETWRDDLIRGIDSPIEEIIERFPEADRQKLLNMTRAAKKEINENRPPKSSRALFRYIKRLAEAENQ